MDCKSSKEMGNLAEFQDFDHYSYKASMDNMHESYNSIV